MSICDVGFVSCLMVRRRPHVTSATLSYLAFLAFSFSLSSPLPLSLFPIPLSAYPVDGVRDGS